MIVGSYVPEGVEVGELGQRARAGGVTAFYDIDTPVTLAKLERGRLRVPQPRADPALHLYLSFTGGPTLQRLERQYGSPMARVPLYCSVDPDLYYPEPVRAALGPGLPGHLQRRPPAGARTPAARARAAHGATGASSSPGRNIRRTIGWPENVQAHRAPAAVASTAASTMRQRFTLNMTRADMIAAGYSPSVRLFEAAACGTPIISDWWDGLDSLFDPGSEIVIAPDTATVLETLRTMPNRDRQAMGKRARERILSSHTAAHRAMELERHVVQAREIVSL